MKNDHRAEYVVRDSVLKLLSETELARVSNAEGGARLADGDEYLDLLGQGVRTAHGAPAPTARLLPKKAVHADTWNRILAVLAAP